MGGSNDTSMAGRQSQYTYSGQQQPVTPSAPPATAPSSATPPQPPTSPQPIDEYFVRRISFLGQETHILCQSANGPCPLLALANTLLLRRAITLPNTTKVTFQDLIQVLSLHALNRTPSSDSEVEAARERAFADSLELFPLLTRGLDMNVRFNGPDSFEFTRELALFDLYGVRVLHGWLPDPQEGYVYDILKDAGYNQAVNVIAEGLCDAASTQAKDKGRAVNDWLTNTSSQLTVYGLVALYGTMRDNALAVLFRNNHFSVILKRGERLYSLVTDAGFKDTEVVWETLQTVDGDSDMLNDRFVRPAPQQMHHTQTRSSDALYAAQYQAQIPSLLTQPDTSDDARLARQLQEQEEYSALQQEHVRAQAYADTTTARHTHGRAQRQPQQSRPSRQPRRDSDCILV
eukprot:m.97176 g.97176  ORF g.97176 m.97176 type:complete len:403 (-) comp13095_c0_seq2:2697-3905(-)